MHGDDVYVRLGRGRPERSLAVRPGVRLALDREGRLLGVRVDRSCLPEGAAARPRTYEPLVGVKEAAEIAGTSRPNFLRDLAARPDFPRPVAELASGRVWRLSDVLDYVQERRRAARQPAGVAEEGVAARYAAGLQPQNVGGEGGKGMKLAEAQLRRQELEERLTDLRRRLARATGDEPSEDPRALLAEIEAVLAHLEALHVWIGRTRVLAGLPDGTSFVEAEARLETLRRKRQILLEAAEALADRRAAAPGLHPGALSRQADALLREHAELATRVQEHTWQTPLMD